MRSRLKKIGKFIYLQGNSIPKCSYCSKRGGLSFLFMDSKLHEGAVVHTKCLQEYLDSNWKIGIQSTYSNNWRNKKCQYCGERVKIDDFNHGMIHLHKKCCSELLTYDLSDISSEMIACAVGSTI